MAKSLESIDLPRSRFTCEFPLFDSPVLRENVSRYVLIGYHSAALKSNIGHLEGEAGIAGLIKTILVLEKGIIPPNANFERLNPKIDAEFLNLKVPKLANNF